MLFALGSVFATPQALDLLTENGITVAELLHRHGNGDYGDLPDDDILQNRRAIDLGERVVSAYLVARQKVYVITEWDRSMTTVLMAYQY